MSVIDDTQIEKPRTSGATDHPDDPQSGTVAPPPIPSGYQRETTTAAPPPIPSGYQRVAPVAPPPIPTGYQKPTAKAPHAAAPVQHTAQAPTTPPTVREAVEGLAGDLARKVDNWEMDQEAKHSGIPPSVNNTLKNVEGGMRNGVAGLYHGLMGDEESSESKGTPTGTVGSPNNPAGVANYGVTPEHMGYTAGNFVRQGVGFLKNLGQDVTGIGSDTGKRMPLLIPDQPHFKEEKSTVQTITDPHAQTLIGKYVTAPSMAEREASEKELEKYYQTHGVESFGHALSAFVHGTLGEYVPFIGPLAGDIMDTGAKGDVGGALTKVAALYATGKATEAVKSRIASHLYNVADRAGKLIKPTPSSVTSLAKDVVEAQKNYDAAKAGHDKYKASTDQGITSPAAQKAWENLQNAEETLNFATADHEMAKNAAPTLATRAGRLVGKLIPTPEETPEESADQITAKQSPAKSATPAERVPYTRQILGEPQAPPTVSPAHATTTIPQEPLGKPATRTGRIVLPNDQGVVGEPLRLTAGSDAPPTAPTQELIPPTKTPKAPKPERGNVKTLKAENGKVIDTEDPLGAHLQRLLEESLKKTKGNENFPAATVEPSTAEDTTGSGFSRSGASPPKGELIPTVRPSATRPASTEAIPTSKAKPEDTLIPQREPGLLSNGEEGRERARTADDYHPAVRQKVYELSNADLDKLANSHGIDPSDPQYSRSKEMRNEGRHQTGRQKLADDITAAMGDDEKTNIGRNIEQSDRFSSKDTTSQSKAEKAAKNFPRLRGLDSLSPNELHENLGFGERNTGVTKEEFEAAKKSFNDKATRSNAGIDPTMLADAYKIAAYYFEGGLREFSAFSKQMISKLGESIQPHLEEIYARAKAHVAPTWKGTAEEWTAARAQVDAATARAKNLPEGPRLPEALGGTRLPEEQPFQGQTLDPNDVRFKKAQIERYVDPKGQFYKTVLKELRKSVASDAASDLAQEVMLDYQQGVIDGRFKVPARPSDEGLVTNQLKAITKNKAADWADKASGVTASGTPRSVVDTKRMSEAKSGAGHMKEAHATDYEVGSSEDESVSKADRNSKSPYGFGEEPDYRNEHSNAQRALEEYLKQNPKTGEADRELLRNASEQSVAKSEAARGKAYDKELAKSGDVEKAIEAGRKAAALTNRNKYNATDRYFGLTDADMTKLGQSHGMTGTKFRARLTAVMDDLNRRATQGNERPRTGPPAYTGDNSYTNFLSGEGPTRPAYSRINVENTPTAGTSTGTSLDRSYGNAEGFISSQPKAGKPEEPDEFSGTREEAQEGTPRPLIEPAPLSKGGKAGTSKIDLEGAAANRERIANARVPEAQKVLSEAITPAAQRKARAELEDAKDRLNYLKALQQPISGGSQGAAVHQIATDYLKELQRGGAEIPKIELAVPEAGNIIHGVEEEAKRFGVNLRSRGFEQPTNVSHEGRAGSTLPRIAIGNPTEATNLIPEADDSDLEKGAGSILAKREGDANRAARAPEEDRLDQLQTIRQRLGLKPSQSARIETVPGSLGNQTPLTSGPDVERLKTRSQAKYSYTEKPFGDSTKHEVTAVDSKGKAIAVVSAVEDTPGTWTVRGSFSTERGAETGYEGYSKLLRQAQEQANATGKPITVRSDPDMLSESAAATWKKLGQREFKGITWKGQGSSARASVTFTPRNTLPKALGGGELPEHSYMPWMSKK